MSRTRYWLLVPALVGVALLTPGITSAGVQIGIGFGTTIGPHHHHGYYGYYGWYGWPGYYYYDPWWYYPAPVVVEPPVIVHPPVREHVVVRDYQPPTPPKDLVSEKVQQQKSELLKKLKIADTAGRVQAAKDLEPFARGVPVRTALEQALLSDREAQVRKTVAEMFGRLQDRSTLRALKQAQKDDSDRDVRQAAYKAIILIEGYNVNGD
jgi:hypothetical protein